MGLFDFFKKKSSGEESRLKMDKTVIQSDIQMIAPRDGTLMQNLIVLS